jgi:ABC-2 type transport system permease protein
MRDVRLVGRQLYYEQLGFWRNPIGAGFTVGFSVVFLVLLSAAAGNSRIDILGNIRVIQYYVPGFVAYGVMSACFNVLAISLVARRDMGLLKRMRLSPIPTWILLGGILLNALVVSLVQVVVLLLIGRLAFDVVLPHQMLPLLLALVVGALSFAALGVAMSSLLPNQEAAGPVTGIVFFVLLFLSGLWYPLDPDSGLAKFAALFPVRHLITAVFAPFDLRPGASPWAWNDLLILVAWGAVGAIISVRHFRWEPHRTS